MGVILGIYWDNGKENGNYREYRGYRRVNFALEAALSFPLLALSREYGNIFCRDYNKEYIPLFPTNPQ